MSVSNWFDEYRKGQPKNNETESVISVVAYASFNKEL